jgi:hypothetical protein
MDTRKMRYFLKFIPDKQYLKICYRLKTHKKLNLENTKSFIEKYDEIVGKKWRYIKNA